MGDTMRAVVLREPGGPEVLAVREVPRPDPAPGEVRVRVAASGINRADLLQRRGRYPAPEGAPRDIPGLEYSGVVDAVGAGVHGVAEGDRVMGIVAGGGYAEHVVAAASTLVPIPDPLDTVEAGAVPEVFMTAYDAVELQAGLSSGETLLVHAVGSGVGTAAVQLAVRRGASVLGTSRTPAKLERAAELGLTEGVLGEASWPERVLEITGGRGADVILDLVGGPYLAGNQRVLASKGRHVVVGVPGGAKAEIDLRLLMGRRGWIRGTVLRARPVEEKAELARAFTREVLTGFDEGALRPVIEEVYPADRVADAHSAMESNANFGKLLLVW